ESEKEELTGVQKKDSVQFDFFDGNRLIRTLKYKTPEKAGFHRIHWSLDEKGPNRPARKINKSKKESSGITVKPGTYKVKIMHGTLSDSTMIKVETDPRVKTSKAALEEVYNAGKKLENYTQLAADAVKQLVENKMLANKFQKEMKDLDKEKYRDQIEASKDIVKEIDSLVALYIGKEDKRQGITRNPEITVMQRLGTARGYVSSRKTGLTKTENNLIQFAQEQLKSTLFKTNAFFTEKWKPYQDSVETLDLSPFKETKIFSLD
ncbi:MAG: hypothetical protein ABJU26_11270, partial [Flavobacteriaceae bacterium]